MKAITNIFNELEIHLPEAKQVWIAVALINADGLNIILNLIPSKCKLNVIAGIDLPSDPKAFRKLLALKKNGLTNTFILKNPRKTFHPKVYIIDKGISKVALVGSGNSTNGGFKNNYEMTISLSNNNLINNLLKWINNELIPESSELKQSFIDSYQIIYDKRIKRNKQTKKEIDHLKNSITQSEIVYFGKHEKLIDYLKEVRHSKKYNDIKKSRNNSIKKFREYLDYPNFKTINSQSFLSSKVLGTIRGVTQSSFKSNISNVKKLLHYLNNSNDDISEKITQSTIGGKYYIENFGMGIISKLLTVIDPKENFVWNKAIIPELSKYDLTFPKYISNGEKYRLLQILLKEILIETDISNFSVFDQCVWAKYYKTHNQ